MLNVNVSDITFFIVAVIAVTLILTSIKVCDQYSRAVVLRFGKFAGQRGPGLFLLLPWGIERAIRVDIRTTTWDLEPQVAITRDNVSVKINAVLWNEIVDAEAAVLKVQDVEQAIRKLAATTIRGVIGQHDLDDVLGASTRIADAIAIEVEKHAKDWGVDVRKLEIADVGIPETMQRVMAQKAEAVREQQARLIKADAEFQAAQKLADAAKLIEANPVALELRRMQMLTEIGAEQNTMTVVMMPSEFVGAAKRFAEKGLG
jgi:regulator of protease activity HflC (stomatin/prohibitin superfamily)